MTVGFVDRVIFQASSGGAGSFTVSSAVQGYQTPAQANAVDGSSYRYAAQNTTLTEWEVGTGVYTASGTTFSRNVEFSSNSNITVPFSTAPQVMLTALAADFREIVTVARTYYVSTTGSDSNSGLAIGSPFLTIQKAIDVITQTLYIDGVDITVQLADGVYTSGFALSPYLGRTSGTFGGPLIQGNTGDKTAVAIRPDAALIPFFADVVAVFGGEWLLEYMEFDSNNIPSTGTSTDITQVGGILFLEHINFGVAYGNFLTVANPGTYCSILNDSALLINKGSAPTNYPAIIYVLQGGIFNAANVNFIIQNAPVINSGVLDVEVDAYAGFHNCTWTGVGVTGPRFNLGQSSRIDLHGSTSLTFFPGDTPGTIYDQVSVYGNLAPTPLQFGLPGAQTGQILFNGTTSGQVTLSTQDAAGTWTMKLPNSAGTNTYVLQTDGSGVTSWVQSGGTNYQNTVSNIIALTPTQGKLAWSTDTNQFLVADGSFWNIDLSYTTQLPGTPDMGFLGWSNRVGYGQAYVTDKIIANCTIGFGSFAGSTSGDFRFNSTRSPHGLLQVFYNSTWNDIVSALALYESSDGTQALDQTPIGQTSHIQVFSGDSEELGLNGLPIIQGYTASMGAYPVKQTVDGGSF